ncbi:MAG: O-antigen ligase family protein [Candidatus Aenigmarchaeota archaeon]|nr:O-antigen ligase family protein [Candidatus Aenigmarchaeota archaeon]
MVWNEFTQPINSRDPDLTKVSVEKRAYIWPVIWQLILQKPLQGYGLENIGKAFADYFQSSYHSLFEANDDIYPFLMSLKELNIDRSHNYLLDLLLFSGTFGLLGWLGLVGVLFWKLRQMSSGRGINETNTPKTKLSSLICYIYI